MKTKQDLCSYFIQNQLERHARSHKLAVVWENDAGVIQQLSYRDLREKALRIAGILNGLSGKGKNRQARIGVWLSRTPDFIATFLACWISGNVYVPIGDASLKRIQENPEFEKEFQQRVQALAEHLDVVVCDAERVSILNSMGVTSVLDLHDLPESNSQTTREIDATSEAFVFCSSGTTSTPKIIAVPHEGIMDRLGSVIREMGILPEYSILNYTGFDFDPSLMEILLALQLGSTLIMAPEYARLDPSAMERFYKKLTTHDIPLPQFAILVPSMLRLMNPSIFKELRCLMTTGENIHAKDLMPWFSLHNSLRIFTGYGPTETTWGATLTEIPRDSLEISITHPMDGVEILLEATEDGFAEILIGGNGQGYYLGNHSEKITARNWTIRNDKRYFLPHDRVQVKDEKLIYCGRADEFFKYHGKWISLETIDQIAERHPQVKFATSICVPESSVIFLYVVPQEVAIYIHDVASHLRSAGFEIYTVFFQMSELKISSRGKKSRKLDDYKMAQILTKPTVLPESMRSLSLIWFQALSETDLSVIQKAFEKIGIPECENYFTCYAPEHRFSDFGGKSLKLARLIQLLWKSRQHSSQVFKNGILRHQSLQEMNDYIQRYEQVEASVVLISDLIVPSFEITLPSLSEESCEILESEIKGRRLAPFYHLVVHQEQVAMMQAYFASCAIVDSFDNRSTPEKIQQQYLQHLILMRLTPVIHSANQSLISVQSGSPFTLLGTACGKTSYLQQMQSSLLQEGKVTCYISCRKLSNLPSYLGLSSEEWEFFCLGEDKLSEITWLIDDIDIGFHESLLSQLLQDIKQYRGKSSFIFAGRENVYPHIKDRLEFGTIHLFPAERPADLHAWFQAEATRLDQPTSEFYSQLQFLFNTIHETKFYRPVHEKNWWATATVELIQSRPQQPPLYLNQYPCFSSLVRFLRLHDTMVYSLREECRIPLQEYLANYLSYSSKPSVQSLNMSQHIPTNIRSFAGNPSLSPWIFFHAISGECPDGYEACAEMIFNKTRQGVYTISQSEQQSFLSLEDQVKAYLDQIAESNIVPRGGAYYFLGWSYGGYLAIEAARQCEAEGKMVAVVVNLDAAPLFAYPNFQWDEHLHYVMQFISSGLLAQTQDNCRRLQHYCRNTVRPAVNAKTYIFAATKQTKTLTDVAVEDWNSQVSSGEYHTCEGDHFSIFSSANFRIQLQKIIDCCHEHADPRSLSQRLQENSLAKLREYEQLATSPPYLPTPLDLRIHDEFLESENSPAVLVIAGVPGIGKSRFIYQLAQELLSGNKWYPIVLPLKQYLGVHDFSTLLQRYGFSSSDLAQLKNLAIRFLFIIDGFDEGDLQLKLDLFSVLQDIPHSKCIITVRKGILAAGQFDLRMQPLFWEIPLLEGVYLQAWEQKFTVSHLQPEKLSSNLTWIRTPMMLNMLLELENSGQAIAPLVQNRFALYDRMNQHLFQQQRSQFHSFLAEEQLAHCYQTYTGLLSLQLSLGVSVSHQSIWNYPDRTTQFFKKTAQLIEQTNILTFPHATLNDYHLAKIFIDAILNFEISSPTDNIPDVLAKIKILKFPKMEFFIDLLVSHWMNLSEEQRFRFRKKLFMILLLTRRFQSHSHLANAAGTALSLLNTFIISFAKLDLSGTRLSECDVSGAILTNVRLQNAELERLTMTNANLEGANFAGTTVRNLDVDKFPTLKGVVPCYTLDGKYLAIIDGTSLYFYETAQYSKAFNISISGHKMRKLTALPGNRMAGYGRTACFVVDTDTRGSLVHDEFYDPISRMTPSPSGNELALLQSKGVKILSVDSFTLLTTLPLHKHKITYCSGKYKHATLAYNPTGTHIAAIVGAKLKVWDRLKETLLSIEGKRNLQLLQTLVFHTEKPWIIILADSNIYIVDFNNRCMINTTTIDRGPKTVASNRVLVSNDRTLQCYEYHNTQWKINTIKLPTVLYRIQISQNGQFLAGDAVGEVYLIDLTGVHATRSVNIHPLRIRQFIFHPHHHHVVGRATYGNNFVWPLRRTATLQEIQMRDWKGFRAPSWFVTQRQDVSIFFIVNDGTRFQFFPHSRKLTELGIVKESPQQVAVRQDEMQFAVRSYTDGVVIQDMTGQHPLTLDTQNAAVIGIAYVPPHGNKIVVATTTHILHFCARTQELRNKIPNPDRLAHFVFSADGKFMAARGESKLVTLIMEKYTLTTHYTKSLSYQRDEVPILHHPRAEQIAIVEKNEILIFGHQDENIIARLNHKDVVLQIIFHPSKNELISLVNYSKMYFWDLNTMDCTRIQKLRAIESPIDPSTLFIHPSYLHHTPDGKYFALGSTDSKRVQIWHDESRELLFMLHTAIPKKIAWLKSPFNNSQNFPLYYLVIESDDAQIKVYEVLAIEEMRIEVTLIWGLTRQQHFQGKTALQSINQPVETITTAVQQTTAKTNINPLKILPISIILQISDYLRYQEYCYFIKYCQIQEIQLRTYHKRPLIEEQSWKKYSAIVGEQLQMLGFFSTKRPVDIHHLQWAFIPASPQSVEIIENNEPCGEYDVFILDDMLLQAAYKNH